jgi:hypothetical protein
VEEGGGVGSVVFCFLQWRLGAAGERGRGRSPARFVGASVAARVHETRKRKRGERRRVL